MKIINYIVTTEGINTERIDPFITNIHKGSLGVHYPNYSISLNNTIATCSGSNLVDDIQYYQIDFPLDTITTNKLEILTFKGVRFPLSTRLKGTKNGKTYFTLIEDSGPFCTERDNQNQCKEDTYKYFNFNMDKFKGFRIEMNGKDSKDSHQLCIGRIEIYGDFFFLCSIPKQKNSLVSLYLSLIIAIIIIN